MLKISEEINQARQEKKGIVALESTIIAHGMPYPQNLEVAHAMEKIVRNEGAVPATIAIIKGEMCVGLNDDELQQLAQGNVMKASTRDIAFAVLQQKIAATTVSATMHIASLAGIKIFATGGLGGVHRGVNTSWDVSTDLMELARTAMGVVSAGAKAILDLPRTLEQLETLGVPVIGFGCDDFPAFYSHNSGIKLSMRLDNEKQVAQLLHTHWNSHLKGGVLIANPIPLECEIPQTEIEPYILRAMDDAHIKGITGKDLTPFLLKMLNQLTKGKSQQANKAVALNNAHLAARIAVEYSAMDV